MLVCKDAEERKRPTVRNETAACSYRGTELGSRVSLVLPTDIANNRPTTRLVFYLGFSFSLHEFAGKRRITVILQNNQLCHVFTRLAF